MKSTPPMLVAAALLLWGVQTDAVLSALVMGVLAESPYMLRWRIDLSNRDFYRITDVTSVAFASLAVFCFVRNGMQGIYLILAWVPYVLFPLVLAQRMSQQGGIPQGALVYALRTSDRGARQIDAAPPFVAVVLVAAATGREAGPLYLAGCAAIIVALLLYQRPRRYPWTVSTMIVAAALVAGLSIQVAMYGAQQRMGSVAMYFFYQFAGFDRDPDQQITAIGMIGRMKLSDRIQVRVHTRDLPVVPMLLHEASYTTFEHGIWRIRDNQFTALDADIDGAHWTLNASDAAISHIDISTEHRKELGLVPLPAGVVAISGSEVVEVQRNLYDAVKLEMAPGQARFQADFAPRTDTAPAPTGGDLEVPASYREAITAIADELDLQGKSPEEIVATVERFFADNYTYSLVQPRGYPGRLPLVRFLTTQRSGHCEYFASATVLLLRAAGVPARYAVGYMLQEYSPLEGAWVARARHRHSWASVYLDGRWQDIDTTPAGWVGLEESAASPLQLLTDSISWLGYRIKRVGRADMSDGLTGSVWLLPPLVLWLAWRLARRGAFRRNRADNPAMTNPVPGRDSELLSLMEISIARGRGPLPGETVKQWLLRMTDGDVAACMPTLALHNRLRFSRRGLSTDDRHLLQQLVARLGARLAQGDVR